MRKGTEGHKERGEWETEVRDQEQKERREMEVRDRGEEGRER